MGEARDGVGIIGAGAADVGLGHHKPIERDAGRLVHDDGIVPDGLTLGLGAMEGSPHWFSETVGNFSPDTAPPHQAPFPSLTLSIYTMPNPSPRHGPK